MNLRSYLRGAGIGLIVAALVLSFSGGGKSHAMTDNEIRERAKALGMTDGNGVLAEAYIAVDAPEIPSKETLSEAAKEDVSGETAFAEAATGEVSTEKADAKADEKTDVKADEKTDVKADEKADAKADEKTDVKADEKTDVKADEKADAKADEKTDVKADEKTDVKADEKAEAKADKKADEKTDKETIKSVDEIIEESIKDAPKADITSDLTGEDKKKSELLADAVETEAQSTPAIAETASGFAVIHVNSGFSSMAVAKALERSGAISSAAAFDQYLCARGYDRKLAAGDFRIPAGSSDEDIALILMRRK